MEPIDRSTADEDQEALQTDWAAWTHEPTCLLLKWALTVIGNPYVHMFK